MEFEKVLKNLEKKYKNLERIQFRKLGIIMKNGVGLWQ